MAAQKEIVVIKNVIYRSMNRFASGYHRLNVNNAGLVFFLLIYFVLFLITFQNGFFWDTTHLASLQAWWYYDHDFRYFFLPNELDSGHPSFFAMLLALMWKLFGVRLAVGHMMMLPFIIILIVEASATCIYYFKDKGPLVAALILLNPIVLGQATLVSPDVVLFGFFFLTLNGILTNNKVRMVVGALILGAVSLRGMMCVAYLGLFAVLRNRITLLSFFSYVLAFLPGIAIAALFLFLHYKQAGWVGYHADSPWGESFRPAGVAGFFRNVLVFGFRMVDMGFIFVWLFLGISLVQTIRKRPLLSKRTRELLLLVILCFLVSVLLQFFYKYSLLHRYLLPFISLMVFVFCSLADERLSYRRFRIACVLSLIGLLSGNLWVYPDPVAKGWDATLAHLPYYELRKKALYSLKERGVPPGEVFAGFPYRQTGKCIDLSRDTSSFSRLPMEKAPYVLYSNISNDFSDDQLQSLKTDWIPIEQFGSWPVRFVLYRNFIFNDEPGEKN